MVIALRFLTTLLILTGLGVYIYLNTDKVDYLSSQYQEFINGKSALDVELKSDSESFFRTHLRSSDIFDATGTRQVNFLSLAPDDFARITGSTEELKLRVNGNNVAFDVVEKEKVVQLIWSDRKLNIVRAGNLAVIAENIAYENDNRKGIYECIKVIEFCQYIRTSTDGIGPMKGPYLYDEMETHKRGLPVGRWGYGPSSTIRIESKISTDAFVEISMLRISEDQVVKVEGPILEQQLKPMKMYVAPYGGMQFYPGLLLVKIRLQPGINNIKLSYSRLIRADERNRRPRAVYITKVRIRPDIG